MPHYVNCKMCHCLPIDKLLVCHLVDSGTPSPLILGVTMQTILVNSLVLNLDINSSSSVLKQCALCTNTTRRMQHKLCELAMVETPPDTALHANTVPNQIYSMALLYNLCCLHDADQF